MPTRTAARTEGTAMHERYLVPTQFETTLAQQAHAARV
jgi:hypothetical protein